MNDLIDRAAAVQQSLLADGMVGSGSTADMAVAIISELKEYIREIKQESEARIMFIAAMQSLFALELDTETYDRTIKSAQNLVEIVHIVESVAEVAARNLNED